MGERGAEGRRVAGFMLVCSHIIQTPLEARNKMGPMQMCCKVHHMLQTRGCGALYGTSVRSQWVIWVRYQRYTCALSNNVTVVTL